MPDDTLSAEARTHRCPDCPLAVEHAPSELCGSCGRCALHCHAPSEHKPPETQLRKPERLKHA